MKNKDVNEIYTLFEEIREIVKAGNSNSAPTRNTRLVGHRRVIR